MIDATTDTSSHHHIVQDQVNNLLEHAIEAHKAMDFEGAEAAYRGVLKHMPEHADANHNLGVLLAVQLLRPFDALPHFEVALNTDAGRSQFWFSYVDGLIRCKHFDLVRQVLPLAQSQGLATAMVNALIERLPRTEMSASVEVVPVAAQEPTLAEKQALVAFFNQRNYVQGEALAQGLVQRCPNSGFSWKALGTMLQPQGKTLEALYAKKRAVQLLPDDAESLCNFGRAHLELGQNREAVEVFRAALVLRPAHAEAYNYLGLALFGSDQAQEAMACFKSAIALNPDYAAAYNNLSGMFNTNGQIDEAIEALQKAISIEPNFRSAFDNLLFVINYHPDKSAEEIFRIYRDFDRRFGLPHRSAWLPHTNSPGAGRRLKVGYVSPDFRGHACSFFIEPLLIHHDANVVDVYAYAELTQEDAATQRCKRSVAHWVPTMGLSDAAMAQRIRADGIDILVDLAGHTVGNRLGVFALKPAPVSVSWMGYGYTTGLQAIDYYLSDDASAPVGCEHLFSEELWRLPGSFLAYRPGGAMGEVNPLPALDRGYITLGTLTRGVRINYRIISVWASILQRLPTAHLVIDSKSFMSTSIQQAAIDKFSAYGISAERLHIGFNSPPWDVLRGIDIGLDCFPHNSGTTLFETLYMGLPFVTLAGRPSVGRIGSSILHGLGRPEWIASTEAEYIEKVVKLASDLPALARHRSSLRSQMQASVLMDEGGFARRLEQAYVEMFSRWTTAPTQLESLKRSKRARRGNQPSMDEMKLLTSFFETRDFAAGVVAARTMTKQYPIHGFGWKALGALLQIGGHAKEALDAKKQAAKLLPLDAEAVCNLGHSLQDLNYLAQAEVALKRALALKPAYSEAFNNLAITYQKMGRLDVAEANFRSALALKPDHKAIYDNLLFTLNYHPDQAAELIFENYQEYDHRFGFPHRAHWRPHVNDRNDLGAGRRLKVGYVSPDFRSHSCTFFLEPLLANHDHAIVEVFAYADVAQDDVVTQRYQGYVDHWVPTWGISDAELARRIRADEIDILVDLAGHTVGNRLGVFARKPAPVSLSWMGYGYTTGLRAIDYYLTDAVSAPSGSEHLFSEEPWRLPGCFAAYRPASTMGEVNALPALERGYVTLGTLTRGIRVNHHTIRVWAEILLRLPMAHIVIDSRSFGEVAVKEATIQQFAAHGIGRERLHIGFTSPPWDVLRGIDIGLDCFPHNSGTTLYETLYMGLPYVTLEGRPSVGCIGSTILHSLGHPEWVARTEEEYVEKVIALVADLPALAHLRATLRSRMQASILMDEVGFTRNVELAYRQMFARWATDVQPDAVEVAPTAELMNTLVRNFQEQDFAQGEQNAQVLVARYPRHGYSWKLLGSFLHQQGKMIEALRAKQRAVQLLPDDSEAMFNLARAHEQQGHMQQAERCYRKVIAFHPTDAEAHHNLGNVLRGQGLQDAAVICYREALRLKPDFSAAHIGLGGMLQEIGSDVEAESVWRSLLLLTPDDVQITMHLSRALQRQGRRAEAEACIRNAVLVKTGEFESFFQRGNFLGELGLYAEAEADYRQALALRSDSVAVMTNLGGNLKEQGRLTESESILAQAIAIDPTASAAWSNYAIALLMQGQLAESQRSFYRALELSHYPAMVFSSLLFALNYDPDKSSEEIFAAYQDFDLRFGQPHYGEWAPHTNPPLAGRRLKVGYVSPDFKNHACTFFLEPLLSKHDARIVEVYAYAELAHEDAATLRYKVYVDHWVPTRGMTDVALAQRIRADGIDILVDLAGHTAGNRLGVFARKPSPVSMSWMGYGYTTGLQAIDYYLVDDACAPTGCEAVFSETPWRMPGSFLVYRPGLSMGEVNPLPALERGYLTLGTLTRGVRINHRTIRVWCALLQRLPTAHIVIDSSSFRDAGVQQAMVAKFVAYGIEAERLHIGYQSPPWDVLRGIDIGLDCFPHNSGTTLFETLYMGLPFVTLAGRPSVGRIGSSILHGVGHPEWIAESEAEYIDLVVDLASNLPALSLQRATLRAQMQASVLMDEEGFARKVETAYDQMFHRWKEAQI